MKHAYRINILLFFLCLMGLFSPVVSNASGSLLFGGSNSTSIYTEDYHDKNLALFRASIFKSSVPFRHLTDSMIVYNNYAEGDSSQLHKVIYEYNPDKILASVYYYQRDSENSVWESYQKEIFQFNSASNQTNFTIYGKAEGSVEWVNQLQRKYIFNNRHQLLLVAEFQWDESRSEWEGQWKHEMDHYSSHLLKSKITYGWNASANDWLPLLKHEFEYHTTGELSRKVSYAFNADNLLWEGQQKSEFAYVDGVLSVQTDYFWDLFSSPAAWVASNKKEYLYNEQGEQLSWRWSLWDRNFSEWKAWWKIEHSKDEGTKKNTWVDAQWDGDSEGWISHWRVEISGERDMPSEEAAYAWNSEGASWDGMYKVGYIYGNEGQLKAKWDYQWDAFYQSWNLNQKHFYFSSLVEWGPVNIIIPNDTANSGELFVYPNPSQHTVFVECSSIIHSLLMYAPDGRLIEHLRPNDFKTEIPVQHLPAGLYIIKTGTANGTRFSKVVVKK